MAVVRTAALQAAADQAAVASSSTSSEATSFNLFQPLSQSLPRQAELSDAAISRPFRQKFNLSIGEMHGLLELQYMKGSRAGTWRRVKFVTFLKSSGGLAVDLLEWGRNSRYLLQHIAAIVVSKASFFLYLCYAYVCNCIVILGHGAR